MDWEPESCALLDPLEAQIQTGRSPAAALMRAWKANPNRKTSVSGLLSQRSLEE